VRYMDVWESEEDYRHFLEDRVRPLMRGMFEGSGYDPPDVEPPRNEIKVLDVWRGDGKT
jgi:hypothetical protein